LCIVYIKTDNMDNNKVPTIVIPSMDNHIEKPVLRRQHAICPPELSPPPLRRQNATMYPTTPEPILRRQNSKELSFDYSEILSESEKK